MGIGIAQLLVILLIVLLLFGAGKIPKLMSDLGKGVKALRKELSDDKDASEAEIISEEEIFEKDKTPGSSTKNQNKKSDEDK